MNIKKYILIIILLIISCYSSISQDSFFNKGDRGITLGGGYTFSQSSFIQPYPLGFFGPDCSTYKIVHQDVHSDNFLIGGFYFPYKYIGTEFNIPLYQSKGISFDEIQSGTILRLPLSDTIPILKNIAPYVGVGGVYNWQSDVRWRYDGKAGVDIKITRKTGLFGEYQYRNDNFISSQDSQNIIEGGLRINF